MAVGSKGAISLDQRLELGPVVNCLPKQSLQMWQRSFCNGRTFSSNMKPSLICAAHVHSGFKLAVFSAWRQSAGCLEVSQNCMHVYVRSF